MGVRREQEIQSRVLRRNGNATEVRHHHHGNWASATAGFPEAGGWSRNIAEGLDRGKSADADDVVRWNFRRGRLRVRTEVDYRQRRGWEKSRGWDRRVFARTQASRTHH